MLLRLWDRLVKTLVIVLAMSSTTATSFVSAVPGTADGSYGWKILGRPSGGRYAAYYYSNGQHATYGGGAKRAHQTVRKPLHAPRLLF